jgi:hypothetical protein
LNRRDDNPIAAGILVTLLFWAGYVALVVAVLLAARERPRPAPPLHPAPNWNWHIR